MIKGETRLDPKQALDRFLASIERRALVTARIATGNVDDALDIVQDAMLQLISRYGGKSELEWGPLFYTILQSRISDWRRRSKVRNRFRVWFGNDDENSTDSIQNLPNGHSAGPDKQAAGKDAMTALETAIGKLPARQQQAFLLRVWEGLDVAQTARTMKCSEGSVKTHYSRAVHVLREQLADHW